MSLSICNNLVTMLLRLLSLSPLANDKVIVRHLVTQSAALQDAKGLTLFYLVPPERTSDNYCSNTKPLVRVPA